MTTRNFPSAPPWMRWTLWAAAVYNLTWGAGVILFPTLPFEWVGMEPLNYPSLWQCIGMIVGVYGVGYGIAASDPLRHWPIVLVGLLGTFSDFSRPRGSHRHPAPRGRTRW